MTCDHCGRPSWRAPGGMGGGIMPDNETHCLRSHGRDCRTAHEGYVAGLRLVAIAAGFNEAIADLAVQRHLGRGRTDLAEYWQGLRDAATATRAAAEHVMAESA